MRLAVLSLGLASGLCGMLAGASPAQAFSIFGVRLWGEDDPAASAGVVDPAQYTVSLELSGGDTDLRDKLEAASLLISQEDFPPSGLVGLLQRARDDQSNLVAKLYERGYFGGIVNISIGSRPIEEISPSDELRLLEAAVPVEIAVTAGPEFTVGRVSLPRGSGEAQFAAVEAEGLVAGDLATSRKVERAQAAVVRSWLEQGYAYAAVTGQDVVADHAKTSLDVGIGVEPGPLVVISGVEVRGNDRLEADFIVDQADIAVGSHYHPEILERAGRRLSKIEALASVSVRMADKAGADGSAPVIIEVAERKPRTIGGGVSFSSTDGLGTEVYWMHRNLWGRGETLRLEAEIARILVADEIDDYNGRISALYGIPGVLGPDTRFDLKLTALQESPDPYDRRGFVAEALFTHDFNESTSLTTGLAYDWSRIDDVFGRNTYSLLSLPVIATYDSRDSVLDPTEGMYARARFEPQYETSEGSLYLETDFEMRNYFALDEGDRFIIAMRGLAGTIWGTDLGDIPAHRRFYAGGGGSVRGYEFLNIGPTSDAFGPTGGLARVEGSLEARIKVSKNIGIVPFIDAGFVTETSGFGGDNEFQVGAGVGLRYYSPVGPLRLDFAVPLNPRKGDPDFAVYFGIGQSF